MKFRRRHHLWPEVRKGKTMGPIKILVVDNEEDERRLIDIILTKFGFSVRTAASAEAAFKEMAADDFQLIITDLIMPEMDGTEFCEKIKRSRPDIRVYAISGYADLYDAHRLEQFGFDGIIHKPFSMASLKEIIEHAVGSADHQQLKT